MTLSKDQVISVAHPQRRSGPATLGRYSGAAVDIDVSKLNAGDVLTFSVDIYTPDHDGLGANLGDLR